VNIQEQEQVVENLMGPYEHAIVICCAKQSEASFLNRRIVLFGNSSPLDVAHLIAQLRRSLAEMQNGIADDIQAMCGLSPEEFDLLVRRCELARTTVQHKEISHDMAPAPDAPEAEAAK